jgi:HAD superfamily hydrolase (TIGR01509 family)
MTNRQNGTGNLKCIFWDNDGVLVDTESFYYEATRSVLATVGIDLTERDYQELFLRQAAGAWHFAKEKGIPDEEVKNLRRQRFDLYSNLVRGRDMVIPGVRSVLARLRSRYRQAVVTSSRRHHFELIHEKSALMEYFEFVLAREDYTLSKPHPEPYLKALERTGLTAGECLVIEDSERGLTAAVNAGIRCWVVPSHLTRTLRFDQAEKILGSVEEVATHLSAD